jgi:E3 ubiquitin-protein ligase synoviolin
MDQTPYPGPSLLFHVRILSLFAILWSIDFAMFVFAVESTLANGVGGMVLFASEVGAQFQNSIGLFTNPL